MKDYIVFTIGSNKKAAKDFAKFWNCPIGKVGIKKFTDGEVLVKTLTNTMNKDVIIIESTAKKPNDHAFEILMLIDSVKRAGAKTVTLIIPYLGYSRQERVNYPNEPISSKIYADVLELAKYDTIMTFDLHHPVIESFFTRGIKNIPTSSLFASYYSSYLKEKEIPISDVVVISPDHGANNRAEMLRYALKGSKTVILDKVRPLTEQVEHLELSDDVKDKTCIIIDDIISTGNTIVSASKLLYKKGAKRVLVGATHAVFAKDAVENMKKARVKDIVVTNTIEQELPPGVKCLDILSLIMQYI